MKQLYLRIVHDIYPEVTSDVAVNSAANDVTIKQLIATVHPMKLRLIFK